MKGQKKLERLEPRFIATLEALKRAELRLGTTPSVREVVAQMAEETDLPVEEAVRNLTSRVHKDLQHLEKLGLVKRLPTPTRCWRVSPEVDINRINWEALLL